MCPDEDKGDTRFRVRFQGFLITFGVGWDGGRDYINGNTMLCIICVYVHSVFSHSIVDFEGPPSTPHPYPQKRRRASSARAL